MRLAAVQFTPEFPGHDANWARIRRSAEEVDADIVVFPELSTCGYCYRDAEEIAPNTDAREALAPLAEIARRKHRLIVGGFAERSGTTFYNSAYALTPEGTHVYRKIHLWDREKVIFQPGHEPLTVSFDGHPIAIEVCYDLQFPELATLYSHSGAEMILAPTAWAQEPTGPLHGLEAYNHLAIATAFSRGVYVVVVNRSGVERGARFLGQSSITDPFGRLTSLGADAGVLTRDLDLSLVRRAKQPNERNHSDGDARLSVVPPPAP